MISRISFSILFCLFSLLSVHGQQTGAYSDETKKEKAERMDWYDNARFGLFIHWGAYSVLDGEYAGKTQKDPKGEWIMRNLRIPVQEYRDSVVNKFNPTDFNAGKWMDLAERAGMKYVVMTTKHHDGFALFDSETSDYNIIDATDYNKDIIKELAEACDEKDLKFGVYYSQAQDWYHPGGFKPDQRWDAAQEGSYEEYFNTVVSGQVSQLFTNYGDISLIWWDSARAVQNEQLANDVGKQLVSLQPGIIVNSRLSPSAKGDFNSFEQVIPGVVSKPYNELCLTHNRSWSYRENDKEWKSPQFVLKTLTHMNSLGSNFLFNVGPDPNGKFPKEAVETLEYIADWMESNSESIYGTEASPFYKLDFGEASIKDTADGHKLYLFVYDWPQDGHLEIKGLKNKPAKARILQNDISVDFQESENGLVLKNLPQSAPHDAVTVIALEINEPLDIDAGYLAPDQNGTVSLTPETALFTTKPQYDCIPELKEINGRKRITNWKNCFPHPRFKNTGNKAHWKVELSKAGKYQVSIEYSTNQEGNIVTLSGKNKLKKNLANTGGLETLQTEELGIINLSKGINTITFTGGKKQEFWDEVQLGTITLKPID